MSLHFTPSQRRQRRGKEAWNWYCRRPPPLGSCLLLTGRLLTVHPSLLLICPPSMLPPAEELFIPSPHFQTLSFTQPHPPSSSAPLLPFLPRQFLELPKGGQCALHLPPSTRWSGECLPLPGFPFTASLRWFLFIHTSGHLITSGKIEPEQPKDSGGLSIAVSKTKCPQDDLQALLVVSMPASLLLNAAICAFLEVEKVSRWGLPFPSSDLPLFFQPVF